MAKSEKISKSKNEVEKGNTIKLDYEGRFENGEIFDSSKHGDHSHPLEFEVGFGQVIPGFDKAVIGMKEGEEKEFSLKPSEAYGERKEDMVQEIPLSNLPELEEKPKSGMILMIGTPDEHQFPATIVSVNDTTMKIDLNHPLAGKTLIFKIKILEVD